MDLLIKWLKQLWIFLCVCVTFWTVSCSQEKAGDLLGLRQKTFLEVPSPPWAPGGSYPSGDASGGAFAILGRGRPQIQVVPIAQQLPDALLYARRRSHRGVGGDRGDIGDRGPNRTPWRSSQRSWWIKDGPSRPQQPGRAHGRSAFC